MSFGSFILQEINYLIRQELRSFPITATDSHSSPVDGVYYPFSFEGNYGVTAFDNMRNLHHLCFKSSNTMLTIPVVTESQVLRFSDIA
jgi:hypothetical protein